MSDRVASVAEAKAHLSELVAAAQAGDEVLITNRGRPVAQIVAVPTTTKRRADLAWLRSRTSVLPPSDDDSAKLVRQLRDSDRY